MNTIRSDRQVKDELRKGRGFYLECAKASSKDRNYMIMCAKNFKSALNVDSRRLGIKRNTAAETAAR